jgi:hypothetical protein
VSRSRQSRHTSDETRIFDPKSTTTELRRHETWIFLGPDGTSRGVTRRNDIEESDRSRMGSEAGRDLGDYQPTPATLAVEALGPVG